LPWRSTRDPWSILVAETMLAQTQVERAAQKYPELIGRFPTPAACASEPVGEIIRLWTGLGYNRRAVALHRAAVMICQQHGGQVPRELTALLALPGVGPYTSRAVLATAYGDDVAVLDTNVGRVLSRAVAGRKLGLSEAQRLADGLVPVGRGREWALATMDFGSLVCRARRPACDRCPLGGAGLCTWRSALRSQARQGGEAQELPDPATGSAAVSVRQSAFAGSDRQGRGRIVSAACVGPVSIVDLAGITGWSDDPGRAKRVADRLVADGVLVWLGSDKLGLP